MADHLFVYLHIAERDATTALPRWQRWLDAMEEATGVTGVLMHRPETRDGRTTWTESYDDVPPAFATTLAALWGTSGPREFVAGERRAGLSVDLEDSWRRPAAIGIVKIRRATMLGRSPRNAGRHIDHWLSVVRHIQKKCSYV